MTKYLLAAIAALSILSILAFWRLDHVGASLDTQTQRVGELEASIASRKETQRLLTQLDTEHTQERERANQTNADLRAAVAAGQRRLSIKATCPAVRTSTGAASLGNAEARADIDPAAGERIIRITNDGDDAIRALTALQDYINTACPAAK
ncbi:lysis system i-spanin subunit Rz [Pseudomonas sp. NBRC 111125]|uniref:lysis system i-spanin subunit Rz n=1 Tax=Pseudomonas sp. NBRC 111125 TaxID=1661040 RepID=UPI000761FA2D|nr:lysis system i-spanin subunit Rz [Pseudomonas sp. NBRC 111125]